MAASGNTPDLPGDVVRCIAGRVAPECRPRMRAVCSAWNAAVPAEPLPWILLQPHDDDGTATADAAERCSSSGGGFSVLSLPTDSKVSLSISTSGGSGRPGPGQRARCFGAGHGWLALVGADLSVTLRNPVTGHAISLPPLWRHPMVGAYGLGEDGLVLWRTWLDYWPNSGRLVPAEEFRDTYVRKVVFSARPRQDDYFAVVLGGYHSYAMYARAGATAWKTVRDADGRAVSLVHDVVHVEGGRFLAVTRCHGKVLEFDLSVVQGGADDDGGDDVVCTAAATTRHATEDDHDGCTAVATTRDAATEEDNDHVNVDDDDHVDGCTAAATTPDATKDDDDHVDVGDGCTAAADAATGDVTEDDGDYDSDDYSYYDTDDDDGDYYDIEDYRGYDSYDDGDAPSPTVRTFAEPLALAESLDYFVRGEDMHVENHLVLIDGELYQIWASREAEPLPPEEQDYGKKMNRYRIDDVGVVRYDREAEGWEAAADLGDWAVLVGRNETVAVRAGDVSSGVSASCVYFIAGELEEVVFAFQLRSGRRRAEAVGGDVLRHACATPLPPVWFLPSLK